MADALQAGAAALQDLIRRVGEEGEADLVLAGDDAGDARDYRALAAMVLQDVQTNLLHPEAAHREGYLRALTHLLSLTADGAGPGLDWRPISDTAAAFARPAVQAEAGQAAAEIDQLAGARAFDAAAQQLASISVETFERDGREDRRAMVAALDAAICDAAARGQAFRFGFLLPVAELMDCARMDMLPSDANGVQCLARVLGDGATG